MKRMEIDNFVLTGRSLTEADYPLTEERFINEPDEESPKYDAIDQLVFSLQEQICMGEISPNEAEEIIQYEIHADDFQSIESVYGYAWL